MWSSVPIWHLVAIFGEIKLYSFRWDIYCNMKLLTTKKADEVDRGVKTNTVRREILSGLKTQNIFMNKEKHDMSKKMTLRPCSLKRTRVHDRCQQEGQNFAKKHMKTLRSYTKPENQGRTLDTSLMSM
jgi:hypothetical protein